MCMSVAQGQKVYLASETPGQAPLFWQPLTNGSRAGLVTLTEYMTAKIGIEEYLMEKFQKFI